MRSVYYSFGCLLVGAVLMYGCGSSKAAAENDYLQGASWQARPLNVDGYDSDWVKPLPYHDKKEKLDFNILNDSTNLYIIMTTADELTQRKILQGGLTVWVNNIAEKTEQNAAGIAFPLGERSSKGKSILPIMGPGSKNKVMELDQLKDYSLFGFGDEGVENVTYGEPNKQGVQVRLDFNEAEQLVYEAAIPLKAVFPKNTSGNYGRRNIAVGFVIDAVPPQPGDRNNNGGGVSIGGGIGTGTFGSGGGMGISIGSGSLGRIGGGKNRYKQSKIWQVVSLARPKN
ncbi:hypothetical protein [Foetidibacter luteolus]|uniref:hypothetical protein n=1 Tax=Foetidibacter luteolus TaxID=2608880 RepID=UPI001A98873B|nr:hypothetical protein [Foetidibacter luteolus]